MYFLNRIITYHKLINVVYSNNNYNNSEIPTSLLTKAIQLNIFCYYCITISARGSRKRGHVTLALILESVYTQDCPHDERQSDVIDSSVDSKADIVYLAD